MAKIVLLVTLLALASACMFLVWICSLKGRATSLVFRQARHRNNDVHKEILSASDELGDENLDLPFVCFGNIVSATNNFSEDNMLGQGGFGKVYKVTSKKILQIKDTVVAVLASACSI